MRLDAPASWVFSSLDRNQLRDGVLLAELTARVGVAEILRLRDEQREDLSFVWEAVKVLPVKYREVIHLFYHEGYSTAETAGILQMKEATVRSSLSRGREQLKSVLKKAFSRSTVKEERICQRR